jgi:hypothetical protein
MNMLSRPRQLQPEKESVDILWRCEYPSPTIHLVREGYEYLGCGNSSWSSIWDANAYVGHRQCKLPFFAKTNVLTALFGNCNSEVKYKLFKSFAINATLRLITMGLLRPVFGQIQCGLA